jgi:hypothetical protein
MSREAMEAVEEIKRAMLEKTSDEHGVEMIERAYVYAMRRIQEGAARSSLEAKLSFAAFADGFCTGYHRGSGTTCTR